MPDPRFLVMENREDEECLSLTSVGVDFHGKNDEKKVLTDPSVCLGRTCSRTVYKRSCFVSNLYRSVSVVIKKVCPTLLNEILVSGLKIIALKPEG